MKKIIFITFLVVISINNIYLQSLNLKITLLKDSILNIEPLSLKIELVNNSDAPIRCTNLFNYNTELFLIKPKSKKLEKIGITNNVDRMHDLIQVEAQSSGNWPPFYSRSLQQPLVDSFFNRPIKASGKYLFKVKFSYIDNNSYKSYSIWSNPIEFVVVKPHKAEEKLYKYLMKLHNPESYVGTSWLERDADLPVRIKESEYMLKTYEESRLLQLIFGTYLEGIKWEAYIKKGENWLDNKNYVKDKLEKIAPLIKDKKIANSINKEVQAHKSAILEYEEWLKSKTNKN